MKGDKTMEYLRRCRFTPYLKGQGPVFNLTTWDTGKRDGSGKSILRYCLKMDGKALFEGEDFACSPLDSIDSDSCINSLMGFLTICPGDTDNEYFEGYTKEQLDYCEQHAEALSGEVYCRFGEE